MDSDAPSTDPFCKRRSSNQLLLVKATKWHGRGGMLRSLLPRWRLRPCLPLLLWNLPPMVFRCNLLQPGVTDTPALRLISRGNSA